MSFEDDAVFNCSYGGKFKIYDGVTCYVGGETIVVETQPQAFFTTLASALPMTLYGQRMWYKLPFEDLTELKLLADGSGNFERMCAAVMYTRVAEVYMEDEDAQSGDNISGYEICVTNTDQRPTDDDHEICEEEARVEDALNEFVDEEENFNYQDTPPNSDGEEEPDVIEKERYRKGQGELKLGQVFDSIKEFKEAVVEYVLKEGWNVFYFRSATDLCDVKCGIEDSGCEFKVYCSYEKRVEQYMIKICQNEHTCIKDGFSGVMTQEVVAKMFLNDIRNDRDFRPKAIQQYIEDHHNLSVSDDICRKGKYRAIDLIQEEHDEQFRRLKDYKLEISDSNPGSTVELLTVPGDDGTGEIFNSFYVCFEALRRIWKTHCRPIFGIDGCFLKSTVKGQLLAAVGRDPNNQVYPVAWAVVQVEDTDSWVWFIQKLKADLELGNGEGFTVISDRQKGLLKAVDQELPKIEHRMCARHIYGNLKSKFPNKKKMKALFWAVAESYNKIEYEAAIEAVKQYDHEVFEAMMQKNPEHCSRAFFTSKACCEDVHNNFSESYNNTIKKARAMPMVEMLETIRRQAMVRIEIRRKKAMKHKGLFSLKVQNSIKLVEKEKKFCKSYAGPNGWFQVTYNGVGYKVNMRNRTCSCRAWEISGIPCIHALRVIMDKKLKVDDYIPDWFLTSKWEATYNDSILPMNGMRFWRKSGESTIQAPKREITKGRTANPKKRFKSKHESPTKKVKLGRIGCIMHCGRCGSAGHNTLSCVNVGVPIKRKPKKPKNPPEAVSVNDDFGGGSSQPTQSSTNL